MATQAVLTRTPELALTVAKMNAIEGEMNIPIIEMPQYVHEILVAVVGRTHIFAFGRGGIAKSFGVDVFHTHMEDGITKFYKMCTRTTDEQELVGNLSIKQLRENDRWAHNTTGMLPEAHLAVLDEIFKCNSIALNALLRIINERLYKANGHEIVCPLWSLVGTSNLDESRITPDLEAFSDRFGCRMLVDAVSSRDGRRKILQGQIDRYGSGQRLPLAHTIATLEDILLLQQAARDVVHPPDVVEAVLDLQEQAARENLHPSPRRWGELMQRMAAHAVLCGREETRTSDLTLAQHMLWTDVDDQPLGFSLILPYAEPSVSKAATLRATLEEQVAELLEIQKKVDPAARRAPNELLGKVAEINEELDKVRENVEVEVVNAQSRGDDTTDLNEVMRSLEQAEAMASSFLGVRKPQP